MLVDAILYAGLLPLIASATFAFALRLLRSPPPIAWPVAITAGFLVAQFTLRGQSGFSEKLKTFFQPHEAVDWLPHIVLLALGVTVVIYLAPTHRRWWLVLAAALCLSAPVRLLSGNVAQHWPILGKAAVLFLLATLLGVVWLLLASNDGKQPTILSVVLQVLVTVGTAIVLTQSGVLSYGLSSAALGAAITGTFLALSLRTGIGDTVHTAGIVTFSLGSLIILGRFYAELSTMNAALLVLSLIATAAPFAEIPGTGRGWQRNLVRILCCLTPLAIAVVSVVA